jgi:hypothetical protein
MKSSAACSYSTPSRRANLDVLEKTLRVGAGLGQPARELRQPSTDERHEQLALGDAMEGREQRLQILLLGELHLVEEERDAATGLARSLAQLEQNILKIDIELPGVPRPGAGSTSTLKVIPAGIAVIEKLLMTDSELLLGAPGSQPLEHHPEAGLLSIAARKLGWRRPGAWCMRIQNLIHAPEYIVLFGCIWLAHKPS